MKIRKHLSIIAVSTLVMAFMVFGATSAFAAEPVISGDCGTNATWVLDTDGVLTITGTGGIKDYSSKTAPWYEFRDAIGKIVVSEGITYIGSYDFAGLTSVTEIILPSTTLRRIGLYSFCGSNAFKSIDIPDSVEEISSYAFQGCSGLEQVVVPPNVTKLQNNAFAVCNGLTHAVLPESVTEIEDSTFYGCTALEEVEVGTKLETIGIYAFRNCTSLKRVDLTNNDSLKVIEEKAFEGCESLYDTIDGKLKFPDSLESVGDDAFSKCTSINVVAFPPNTVLGERVFRYDTGITLGVLPQNAKEVPDSTFYGCTSMIQADLPEKVEVIHNSAFMNCKSMKFCVVPDTVTEFGEYCFAGCESLPEINIPEGVKEIPNAAFARMTELINVRLPESLESIDGNAFVTCSSLERAVIPKSVTYIGGGAFGSSFKLKCIVILNKNVKMDKYAFPTASNGKDYIPIVLAKDSSVEDYFVNYKYLNFVFVDDDFDFYTHTCDYVDWITPAGDFDGSIRHMCKYCGDISEETVIPTVSARKIDPWQSPYDGTRKTPSVTIWDQENNLVDPSNYDVTYPEDTVNIGEYEATITYKGLYTGTDTMSYYIIGDLSKKSTKVSISSITDKVYTGSYIKPTPTVKAIGPDGTVVKLVNGTDYTLEYSNNLNVGKATVIINGKGNYDGTVKATFNIKAKAITPKVTLSYNTTEYNGKVKKPSVTVKDGTTTLASSNYDITYAAGRKNVGSYKVTVKMKGIYSGSASKTFKINPKGTTLGTLTPASKALTVKWTKQTALMGTSRITGYQVQVATDKDFTKNKKNVTVNGYSTSSKKITNLTGGKKYYVRIRTYKTVSGTKYWSSWSKEKTVTTKK